MGILLFIMMCVFFTLIARMIYRKKVSWVALIVSIALLALLSGHIIAALIIRQRAKGFQTDVYDKIAAISWEDKDYGEYLKSIGFSNDGAFWYYKQSSKSVMEASDIPYVRFSIDVEKIGLETAIEKYGLSELSPYGDKGVYVEQSQVVFYKNFFYEFIGVPIGINRSCEIYCNGYLVWILRAQHRL